MKRDSNQRERAVRLPRAYAANDAKVTRACCGEIGAHVRCGVFRDEVEKVPTEIANRVDARGIPIDGCEPVLSIQRQNEARPMRNEHPPLVFFRRQALGQHSMSLPPQEAAPRRLPLRLPRIRASVNRLHALARARASGSLARVSLPGRAGV